MKVQQILSCIVLAAGTHMTGPLLGLDFRVETDVFVGAEKDPAVENLTLFTEGKV